MNQPVNVKTYVSACPHDCPSTCALEVEVLQDKTIGRVRGARDNSYTDGVICAKVARYRERLYHENRLLTPKIRKGKKGEGVWQDISWEAALDVITENFNRAEEKYGSETVWPYQYAGTMGFVQRDSIQRLCHAKKYSNKYDTICVNLAWAGFSAATGKLMGVDPREMAQSDCVVIWGTNPVSTQVNVMTHAIKARKQRGAKIIAVDVYHNDTMKQADLALCLKPGTDGALACALMHCLFRDGKADWDYLTRYSDDPKGLEHHLQSRSPVWASHITGLEVAQIEACAALLGERPRSYFRLGYGFTRSRNGASNMHAVCSIPTVMGAWQHEGGGGFHGNGDIYHLNLDEIKGEALRDLDIRYLDQSKIGRILCGDEASLYGGPPVTAMLIQNTNPLSVAPEQDAVKKGFAREDLFVAVHEHFMTETAEMADLVLPATMFLEHDDIYRGGGQQHIVLGPKLVEPPENCRSNLFVIEQLAQRLGVAHHSQFGKTERELIDQLLQSSGYGRLTELETNKWIDCQPDFAQSHYLDGFAHEDKKYHFKADWHNVAWGKPPQNMGLQGAFDEMPQFPDHWAVIEQGDEKYPYRLATSPARTFLNSTFNETQSSLKREGRPFVFMHPEDAQEEGLQEGDKIRLFNERGACLVDVKFFSGLQKGVLVAEGLFPNHAHEDGRGINSLTGADAGAPHGGAAFHDNKVAIIKIV